MTAKRVERSPRRILIFRIGELGDTLIALPAIRAIRHSFPAASITFLGNSAPGRPGVLARDVLPPRGLVDEWRTYSSDVTQRGLGGRMQLLADLRRERHDLLVYLAPRLRPAAQRRRDLLFFRLAGIRDVVGHTGFGSLPRTEGVPLPAIEHETDHLLRRLSLSGIRAALPSQGDFDLGLTDEERAVADAWLQKSVPSAGEQTLVAVGPGSKWPSKVWPEQRFIEVGLELIRQRRVFPIVFGGAEDRLLGERLISAWGTGANAAGVLSPRQAAAAMAKCVCYVGNDTGTMHLAASAGTRCVGIMAAIDWPGRWNPYGSEHLVLRRSVTCEGCLLRTCTVEGMRCLTGIGTDDVLACCRTILDTAQIRQTANSL